MGTYQVEAESCGFNLDPLQAVAGVMVESFKEYPIQKATFREIKNKDE